MILQFWSTFPDPAWMGKVSFVELIFGTWLSYILLVIMWEKVFKAKLEEWRYVFITFLGASFFLINHYYNEAPFYLVVVISYTVIYSIIYYFVLMRPLSFKVWKIIVGLATVGLVTVAYMFFEMIPRWGSEAGINEFFFMLMSYFGSIFIFAWRFKANIQSKKE